MNIEDRHARAIARLVALGHAATEDDAVDLLARLILRYYGSEYVATMKPDALADAVALAKKGGAR